jgi:hypothetical protein
MYSIFNKEKICVSYGKPIIAHSVSASFLPKPWSHIVPQVSKDFISTLPFDDEFPPDSFISVISNG